MPRIWSIVAREVAEVDRVFGDVVAEVVGVAEVDVFEMKLPKIVGLMKLIAVRRFAINSSGGIVSKLMSENKVPSNAEFGKRPAEAYCFLNCRTLGGGAAR